MNCNVFAHQYKWSHNSYYFTHISNSWMPRGFVCNYEYLQTMHMYRGFKSETIIKNLTRHYNYINIQIWSQLVFHAYITLRLLHFLKSLEQHFNDMTCTIVSCRLHDIDQSKTTVSQCQNSELWYVEMLSLFMLYVTVLFTHNVETNQAM